MSDIRPGPLTRIYQDAKNRIIDRLDMQELNNAVNRRVVPADFPLPAKLLAVPRSRKNLILEISPLIEQNRTGGFGKKST
jgi:hypothetical protein